MAQVTVHRDDIELDEPILIEGLPGLGLVGKIAVDHLVDTYDMPHYASCHCEGLPEIAIYDANGHGVEPPVRIPADPERDLLVLQSDVPVSPSVATEFSSCVTGWFAEHDVLPLYVTGTRRSEEQTTNVFAISTGTAESRLESLDVMAPDERGVVSGPTGALLYEASRSNVDSLGFIVEANPQLPDPAAAKVLLEQAIEPLAGVDIDTDPLVEHAQEISEAKEKFARRLQEAGDERSQAQPVGMFQ
jgi:uncharacterized protein